MRRELAIIGSVLVPFAVLVVLGLWWSARSLDAPPTPHVVAPTADAAPAPPRTAETPAAADAGRPIPPELAAPLSAVRTEVLRCFTDQRARAPGPVTVTMAFTPTRDGGFSGVTVERTSWEDPYLRACLEDVFEELSFEPSGRETFAPATFTFDFDPSRD